MIRFITREFRENNLGVRENVITFFSIPIYKSRHTTTNQGIVTQLSEIKQKTQIKGFKS